MVKALIATAILALALIFGGYALEKTTTTDAAAQVEGSDQYHHGCRGVDKQDRKDREKGRGPSRHGDYHGEGLGNSEKPYHDGDDSSSRHTAGQQGVAW